VKLARPDVMRAFWFGEAAQLTAESLDAPLRAAKTKLTSTAVRAPLGFSPQ